MNLQRHYRAHRLALAGLLHDLGKVGQPAELTLPKHIQELEQHFCPTLVNTTQSTHRHVMYTARFMEAIQHNYGGLDIDQSLFRLTCAHHRPDQDQFDHHLLVKADWLASGHDRRPDESEDAQIVGLRPILATIEGDKNWSAPEIYVPTSVLEFTEASLLPVKNQTMQLYREGCLRLSRDIEAMLNMEHANPLDCIESIMMAMARSTVSVPSSRSKFQAPDVSLWDHSRLVAAFASCLAILHENGPCDAHQIEGRYRLLGFSLGSIQDFLFRFVPPLDQTLQESSDRGAAKLLRARSFLVSIAAWLATRKILKDCDLSAVHQVFDAGGRSLLLLPDEPEVMLRASKSIREVEAELYRLSGGLLRFDFGWSSPLSDAHFRGEAFSQTFAEFQRTLSTARFRISNRFRIESQWLDTPWVAKEVSLQLDEKKFIDHLKQVGSKLPKAKFAVLNPDDRSDELESIEIFSHRLSLFEKRPRRGNILELLPTQAMPSLDKSILVANHIPVADDIAIERLKDRFQTKESLTPDSVVDDSLLDDLKFGQPLTFEHIAHLASSDDQSPAKKPMLGVLKADVDNLGMILTRGLGKRASIGRFASVSRSLDLFFRGFLSYQLGYRYPYIYTVYAGGDDLFLIGPWLDIIRFSGQMQQWFQAMTGGNPNLTFSAGVILCNPGTPVRQMAAMADQALDQSKESGRNRITLGSYSMEWNHFCQGLEKQELLYRLVNDLSEKSAINASLLYRLLKYAKQALDCTRENARATSSTSSPRSHDWRWRSQMNYDLRRNLFDDGINADVREFREWILNIQNYQQAAQLYVAAMLALYRLRGVI